MKKCVEKKWKKCENYISMTKVSKPKTFIVTIKCSFSKRRSNYFVCCCWFFRNYDLFIWSWIGFGLQCLNILTIKQNDWDKILFLNKCNLSLDYFIHGEKKSFERSWVFGRLLIFNGLSHFQLGLGFDSFAILLSFSILLLRRFYIPS